LITQSRDGRDLFTSHGEDNHLLLNRPEMENGGSAAYRHLAQYIRKRMRMSHIYQPLMMMELLGRSSPAPAEDIARRILGEDSSQIEYYTERVKRMVGRVLTGNGITNHSQGVYSLVNGEGLTDRERDQLLQLCREKLDAFRAKRGDDVFAHRSRHRTAISGSIRYRVFTRARGRCECCGAHEHQAALEVDHIIPKNLGGSDDISNFQALCFRCNAGKRDSDSTDFRGVLQSYGHRQD
jgi:ATP adenylyltransferase